MIRCVRLWTGDDDNSYFVEGVIELEPGRCNIRLYQGW